MQGQQSHQPMLFSVVQIEKFIPRNHLLRRIDEAIDFGFIREITDLAKVGIEAKLVTFDWPTYLAKSKNGEQQLLQMGWTGDNGDPDNFLQVLLSCAGKENGGNRARWCDKNFDDLINKARTVSDQKKRTEFYLKAQNIHRVFVSNMFNKPVPLQSVASIKRDIQPANILRENRSRYIQISADIAPKGPGLGGAMKDVASKSTRRRKS